MMFPKRLLVLATVSAIFTVSLLTFQKVENYKVPFKIPRARNKSTQFGSMVAREQNRSRPFEELTDELDCERKMPNLDVLWIRLRVITGISQNHEIEVLGMIGSTQRNMPQQQIIVYDLGMSTTGINKIKQLCNVEVRPFKFFKYPPHVRNLQNYAWKIIIIKETLFEFGAIFWGDSSVRFKASLRTLFPYLHLHHGYMFHVSTYDAMRTGLLGKRPVKGAMTCFNYTHPGMFNYLKVDRKEYMKSVNVTPCVSGGLQLLVNNSLIYRNILALLWACALDKNCISPVGADLSNHRFDQALISLLIYKNMRHEWTQENYNTSSGPFSEMIKVCRGRIGDQNTVIVCKNRTQAEIDTAWTRQVGRPDLGDYHQCF